LKFKRVVLKINPIGGRYQILPPKKKRRKKVMKKMLMVVLMVGIMVWCGTVMAAPKYVDVQPYMEGDQVIIPPLPKGAQIVNVTVWDDTKGIPGRAAGEKHRFLLQKGEGFNFMYKDAEGTWWQMITSGTRPGRGLCIDCTNQEGCKYLRK
jgi:hypothetical protein